MKVIPTKIPDVWVIEPTVYSDHRGWFYESFNHQKFSELLSLDVLFVQDNHSLSHRNTLRGLHYQLIRPQGKLVRVLAGEILDVAVDIRRSSSYFGQYVAYKLSAENKHQLWIPVGFAHGFLTLTETAEVMYKTTDYYYPQGDRTILWCDQDLAIDWQLDSEPILSEKDRFAKPLKDAELFA
ncbi:dTDP-4-dehydrorhamnose 3,5-epimerase [Synechococcus sp. C9]|jgi:dTDP-4-dehydrorhamnose 3,5-epimerase|uniref:dTDP-4-dehydrorhamnose 3,5-epimerase n=1 Tax=Synechococcus sp. C9 TaxID=102119 RepID=UPI001FF5F942|nr:dTDP-4-dehydrorhamnose 3,5-epimerase [Synechococcus sp. C9]